MSTTPYVLFSDTTFIEFKDGLDKKLKAFEDELKLKSDSKLGERFEILKKEMEDALNKMAEGGKTLQDSVKTLADSQADTIKKLNIAFDEIRAIGGKNIPKVDPEPVKEVKSEIGVSTLFDWDD